MPLSRTSVQTPAAYSIQNLQGPQLAARLSMKYVTNYANVATADAAAQADGTAIIFPAGTYAINANTTITADVVMHKGAKFAIATGVTLSLLGNVTAAPRQIFAIAGTGAIQFGSAANQWPNSPPVCYPEWWGAGGVNGSGDDTLAVQAAFDSHRPVLFLQHYPVSQVILRGNELRVDFNGFQLQGNAGVATKSVLDIKCGYSTLHNIEVSAQFNPLYECAIHWYTNDLNTYYPGFNRIYGCFARNALLGLCIGGLPSQALPLPAAGTVQATGVATDAPLSESTIFGLQTVSCVRGLWVTQPNGKIDIAGGIIAGSNAGWSSYGASGYTKAFTCALVIRNDVTQSSEVNISGGALEQNSEPTGLFLQINNGHLYCGGTCFEAEASSYFAGIVNVSFERCVDLGFNFPGNYAPFLIDTNASGALNISNCTVSYPAGSLLTGSKPLVKGASSITGTFSVNTKGFVVNLSAVELGDVQLSPINSAGSYDPPILGVEANYKSCRFTSYNGTPAIIALYPVDDSTDRLQGVIDSSAYIITAFGFNGAATSGGWTFTVSNGGTCKWGSAASGATVLGKTIDKALQLFAPAAGNTTATTPKFAVHPQRPYTLRAWAAGGVTGSLLIVRVLWYKFDGTAASTASSDMFNAADTLLGATIQPVSWVAVPPKDACQAALYLEADNGATLTITDLSLK